MSGHLCHANRCKSICAPSKLMCLRHWKMVPRHLQNAVYDTFKSGQERTKSPSREWVKAARNAINYVYEKEYGV